MGNSRSPLAWMAGRRETDCLKPIDKAIERMVNEFSGRNESEGTGALENQIIRKPNPRPEDEGSMDRRENRLMRWAIPAG